MRHFLELFAEKLTKTTERDILLQKMQVLAKSTIFRAFLGNGAHFATFFWKVDQNAETL